MLTPEKAKELQKVLNDVNPWSFKTADTGIIINNSVYLSPGELKSLFSFGSCVLLEAIKTAGPAPSAQPADKPENIVQFPITKDPNPNLTEMIRVINGIPLVDIPEESKATVRNTVINSLTRIKKVANIPDNKWLVGTTLLDFILAGISNSEIAVGLIAHYVVDYDITTAGTTFMFELLNQVNPASDCITRALDGFERNAMQQHLSTLSTEGDTASKVNAYTLLKRRVAEVMLSTDSQVLKQVKAGTYKIS